MIIIGSKKEVVGIKKTVDLTYGYSELSNDKFAVNSHPIEEQRREEAARRLLKHESLGKISTERLHPPLPKSVSDEAEMQRCRDLRRIKDMDTERLKEIDREIHPKSVPERWMFDLE